jgi:thiol-disulfide isomerase/thioredoxin
VFHTIYCLCLFLFLFDDLTLLLLHGLAWTLEGPPLPGMINILGEFLACFLGYIFYTKKDVVIRTIVLLFSAAICLYYYVWGYTYWTNYITFGQITEITNKEIPPIWTLYVNQDSNYYKLTDPNSVILLDFFSTECGVCFQKFPYLQKLHEKYKNNSKVFICAMNVPWKRDTIGRAIAMVRKRKYTFPVLISKQGLDSILQIEFYPTVIVIKNNSLIYKGTIENVEETIDSMIK